MKREMETTSDQTPHKSDLFDQQIQRPELRTRLINLARRKGIPEADCEDVASEIIAEAIRCRARYDPQDGSVETLTVAIGENVIRSHFRGLNAQKRKPEGGIISSDAPADADANPLEITDTRAEAERKASEEAEHFLHAAKLSNKEAAAIGSQRNKQFQGAGSTDNSSAGRRAMKKLKQVATDENFQERPRGPEATECAYGNIPAAEHDMALLYDAARRIPWFVEEVARWRNSPEWTYVQAFLADERAAKRFPFAIRLRHWPELLFRYRCAAHKRDPELRRRFENAVEIALVFPEWPSVSYCRLKPNLRRQRLEQLLEEFGWQFGSEPFWEINDREFEIFVSAADQIPEPKFGLTPFLKSINEAPQNDSDTYSSVHLVRIDKRYPLKTFLASAEKFWRNKVEGSSKTIAQSGRPRTARLVGFALVRLIDDFDLTTAEAISWVKTRFGRPVPSTPERLEGAARAAREQLKHFLLSPSEIGL
jgi:DNA-directed RNA polymerase specialized sigma24 family protein